MFTSSQRCTPDEICQYEGGLDKCLKVYPRDPSAYAILVVHVRTYDRNPFPEIFGWEHQFLQYREFTYEPTHLELKSSIYTYLSMFTGMKKSGIVKSILLKKNYPGVALCKWDTASAPIVILLNTKHKKKRARLP